jgi:hypothetical protein
MAGVSKGLMLLITPTFYSSFHLLRNFRNKSKNRYAVMIGSIRTQSIWFDDELGEKNFYAGIVCDEHMISDRVEKLAQPKAIIAAV